jgi:hypothetical protein
MRRPGQGVGRCRDDVPTDRREYSYGYSTLPNVMFGPYLGSVAQSLYTAAAAR